MHAGCMHGRMLTAADKAISRPVMSYRTVRSVFDISYVDI